MTPPSDPGAAISDTERPHGFALRLALFYAAVFGLVGTYLPFFPVWLQAIGMEPGWIGLIVAMPALTRCTVLPFMTAFAERRHALRAAMRIAAFGTAFGFAAVGLLSDPLALLVVFALTACLWTPIVPLTDGYALKAVARYGLNYGPLRLWGSAAFIVGALGSGIVMQTLAAQNLIGAIIAVAAFGALAGLWLAPTPETAPSGAAPMRAARLLRDPGFLAIIGASALIQGSHVAQYTFASIAWQRQGISGPVIAGLWVLGVLAEIVLFALSPRLRLEPARLVAIAAAVAVLRWSVMTLSPPLPVLALIQVLHGLTFGLTMVATMALLGRHVPAGIIASAQGYLAAATGITMGATAIAAGPLFARFGDGLYGLMAAMAFAGGCIIWIGRRRAGVPLGVS